MPRVRKACAAVAPAEKVRPKILRARVLVTSEGPGGVQQTTETDLPPDALAMLSEADVGVPTVADVADAAQRAAELHLTLLRVDRSLVPAVDVIASVLVALPGVAAELERRAKVGR